MTSRQETGIAEDWQQHTRMEEAIYREEGIVPYCRVSIVRNAKDGRREVLHTYDLPRQMVWDRMWVIEWRRARFVCRYPKDSVWLQFSFYDKTSGLEMEYGSLLSKKISAKSLLSRYKNAKAQYVREREKELFFDYDNDENIKKLDAKIKKAENRLFLIQYQIDAHQRAEDIQNGKHIKIS